MTKSRRVEVRLSDDCYQTLLDRSKQYDGNITRTIEGLLRVAVPVRILGVTRVGATGRRRFSVQFSSGMVVHGFLWSCGKQLLGPRVLDKKGKWCRIVDGSPDFWHALRDMCEQELEPKTVDEALEHEPLEQMSLANGD
jgi:hypothetical protein